jgi:hypothetical protein
MGGPRFGVDAVELLSAGVPFASAPVLGENEAFEGEP